MGPDAPARDVAPPVVVAAGILVAATVPVPDAAAHAPEWSGLAAHAVMYAALAAALLWTCRRRGWPHPALWAFGLAVAYGVLHETVQAFLPWRSASALDVLADAVGAAGAVVVDALRRWVAGRSAATRGRP